MKVTLGGTEIKNDHQKPCSLKIQVYLRFIRDLFFENSVNQTTDGDEMQW
ncbi:hypothetical protein NIES4101_83060 [Calothrix sp. NIES-4101]|nr:hypothetical protein NIES4101_83060 [Calothrix sp. NIES-4101]